METNTNATKTKELRSRTFEVVQYEVNPKTGAPLFSEQNIINGLTFQTISKWAYILHDKDVYDEEEENAWLKRLAENDETPEDWKFPVRAGDKHLRHWHIVLYCSKAIGVRKIAEWFGVPESQVDIPKGHGAFWDKVEYLTHEHPKQQAKGRYRYGDEEVHSNIDWRAALDERKERKKHCGGLVLSDAERLQYDVLYNGRSLEEAQKMDPVNFMKYFDKLKRFRAHYLLQSPPPMTRINYYVDGEGGTGKGLLCRALARSIRPDITEDRKLFFNVGAKGAAFEGYDGQPILIWNDRRAVDLLNELSGRGNVFNVFDTHPTDLRQNVKYNSVVLSHEVNIINGIEPYKVFLDGLAGEYKNYRGEFFAAEDKSQSYRRFPFIIRVHEEDFDWLLNKGFATNTRNYEEYIAYRAMQLNWQMLQVDCGNDIALEREIEAKAVLPIAEKHRELLAISDVPVDKEAIRAKYAGIGVPQKVVLQCKDGTEVPLTGDLVKQAALISMSIAAGLLACTQWQTIQSLLSVLM